MTQLRTIIINFFLLNRKSQSLNLSISLYCSATLEWAFEDSTRTTLTVKKYTKYTELDLANWQIEWWNTSTSKKILVSACIFICYFDSTMSVSNNCNKILVLACVFICYFHLTMRINNKCNNNFLVIICYARRKIETFKCIVDWITCNYTFF